MPFRSKKQRPSKYHTRRIVECKYCDEPAKRNVRPDGRNKGYFRTCGKEVCLKRQYHDKAVNARKSWSGLKVCEKCQTPYTATSMRQRWCTVCVPTETHRGIMQRYGLSKQEYDELMALRDGKCQVCLTKKATVVDHDHSSGRVRGGLCQACNGSLHLIEDRVILMRAIKYLGIEL